MKRFAVAGMMLSLSFAGMLHADEKDLKEIEGSYSIISLKLGGRVLGKDDAEKTKVRFKGDVFSLIIKGEEKGAQIKLDISKHPRTIDLIPNDGPDKGKTYLGIYKIEKDELTIAFAKSGERPKEFTSENDVTLVKLKKEENK
jgi:uncharacterized protein (TIGR03067 family)